jgi:hypothetical protein
MNFDLQIEDHYATIPRQSSSHFTFLTTIFYSFPIPLPFFSPAKRTHTG